MPRLTAVNGSILFSRAIPCSLTLPCWKTVCSSSSNRPTPITDDNFPDAVDTTTDPEKIASLSGCSTVHIQRINTLHMHNHMFCSRLRSHLIAAKEQPCRRKEEGRVAFLFIYATRFRKIKGVPSFWRYVNFPLEVCPKLRKFCHGTPTVSEQRDIKKRQRSKTHAKLSWPT